MRLLKSTPVTVGAAVLVQRGKYAGHYGEVTEASQDFAGFWWVCVQLDSGKLTVPQLLAGGQLQVQ